MKKDDPILVSTLTRRRAFFEKMQNVGFNFDCKNQIVTGFQLSKYHCQISDLLVDWNSTIELEIKVGKKKSIYPAL